MIQAPAKEKTKAVPTAKPKPGAPAKRVTATKKENERSLQRVLSNERMRRSVSRGPGGTIALLRSASATAIPGLKREGSEPLLGMIPKTGEAVAVKEKNVSIFSRSAGSLANNADAKAKKKERLEAELKEAISALKKPNRALAGKAIVEEAEKRTAQPKSSKFFLGTRRRGAELTAHQSSTKSNQERRRLAFKSRLPPRTSASWTCSPKNHSLYTWIISSRRTIPLYRPVLPSSRHLLYLASLPTCSPPPTTIAPSHHLLNQTTKSNPRSHHASKSKRRL